MKVGDRVLHRNGYVGIVTEMDGRFIDVNWLTSDDEPSVLTSTCDACDLMIVPGTVRSPAQTEEQKAKGAAFIAFITEEIQRRMPNERPAHDCGDDPCL